MLKKVVYLMILGFTFSSYAGATNEDSNCPALFMAVVDNDKSVIETLLEYGADPNPNLEGCRGNEFYDGFPEGSTLLHIAAYYTPFAYIPFIFENTSYHLLVNYEADQDVINDNGHITSDIIDCRNFYYFESYCRNTMSINSPMPMNYHFPSFPFKIKVSVIRTEKTVHQNSYNTIN